MKYARGQRSRKCISKKDGESAKVISQSFHAWLGGAIETKIANALRNSRREVGDVSLTLPRACRQEPPSKTVIAEEGFMARTPAAAA